MTGKTYMVFVIQAYESMTEAGQLIGYVELQLIDTKPENALARARKLVSKAGYRISTIIEKLNDQK